MAVRNFPQNFLEERAGFFGSLPVDTYGHFNNFSSNADTTLNSSVTSGVTLNGLAWMIHAQQTCCNNILTENKKLCEKVSSLQETVKNLQTDVQQIMSKTEKGGPPSGPPPPKTRLLGALTVSYSSVYKAIPFIFSQSGCS